MSAWVGGSGARLSDPDLAEDGSFIQQKLKYGEQAGSSLYSTAAARNQQRARCEPVMLQLPSREGGEGTKESPP